MTCLTCFLFICVFVIVLALVKVVRDRWKSKQTWMEEIPHTCDFLVEWAWVVEYYKLDLLYWIYFHIGKVHTYHIGIHVSPMKKWFIIGSKVVMHASSPHPPTPPPTCIWNVCGCWDNNNGICLSCGIWNSCYNNKIHFPLIPH